MTNNLSDPDVQAVRERLNKFISEDPTKRSNTIIARNVGGSTSYVSQFRNGKFPSLSTEVEFASKIESFLDRVQSLTDEDAKVKHLKFVMTKASEDIMIGANYAQDYHKIITATGIEGLGRTFTCKEILLRQPNSILVEAYQYITHGALLDEICAQLKIPVVRYKDNGKTPSLVPKHRLFKQVNEKLIGTQRLLMFDEGEHLTTSCLEIIRRIHDFTGVGVLLSGTEKLINRLQGERKELRQLYSRIGMHVKVDQLTKQDVKSILQANLPEALKLTDNFLQLTKNNARTLENLIDLAKSDKEKTGEELNQDTLVFLAKQLFRVN